MRHPFPDFPGGGGAPLPFQPPSSTSDLNKRGAHGQDKGLAVGPGRIGIQARSGRSPPPPPGRLQLWGRMQNSPGPEEGRVGQTMANPRNRPLSEPLSLRAPIPGLNLPSLQGHGGDCRQWGLQYPRPLTHTVDGSKAPCHCPHSSSELRFEAPCSWVQPVDPVGRHVTPMGEGAL